MGCGVLHSTCAGCPGAITVRFGICGRGVWWGTLVILWAQDGRLRHSLGRVFAHRLFSSLLRRTFTPRRSEHILRESMPSAPSGGSMRWGLSGENIHSERVSVKLSAHFGAPKSSKCENQGVALRPFPLVLTSKRADATPGACSTDPGEHVLPRDRRCTPPFFDREQRFHTCSFSKLSTENACLEPVLGYLGFLVVAAGSAK